jgi:hypothetical protein
MMKFLMNIDLEEVELDLEVPKVINVLMAMNQNVKMSI